MMNPESLAQTGEARITAEEAAPLEEAAWRMGTWGLLATLLRREPDQAVLDRVAAFAEMDGSGPELQVALASLGLAAASSSPEAVSDEFHDLFIGIGRGELLPYGSWYQTGFLMERPLSLLREDLRRLGYAREEGNAEPEDHVAALCEVMALMIQDQRPEAEQAAFYDRHVRDWMGRFFEDLGNAESAVFYRSVGRLGSAFLAIESAGFDLQ